MKCLLIAAKRTKYFLTTEEIAEAPWADASLKHLQESIKDWRSNSLRILLVSAKMVG
jgi:hypothetical protein